MEGRVALVGVSGYVDGVSLSPAGSAMMMVNGFWVVVLVTGKGPHYDLTYAGYDELDHDFLLAADWQRAASQVPHGPLAHRSPLVWVLVSGMPRMTLQGGVR